jgi:hypothetical protein
VTANALAFYRANRDPVDYAVNSVIVGTVGFHIETSISICNTPALVALCFARPNALHRWCRNLQKECVGESMKERPDQITEFVAARRRAVLPPSVSRPLKRSGGRASPTPGHVRVSGVALSDDDRADIRRRLGTRLGKFAWSIERVTVRARDGNGPRGGVDQECTVKVVLSGLPSVIVKRRDALLHVAIDEALHAAEQAVRRSVRRRRMKPLHGRSSRQATVGGGRSLNKRRR